MFGINGNIWKSKNRNSYKGSVKIDSIIYHSSVFVEFKADFPHFRGLKAGILL